MPSKSEFVFVCRQDEHFFAAAMSIREDVLSNIDEH